MAEKTQLRKLLVLRGPVLEAEGIVGFLKEHFDVEIVKDFDQAMAGMRRGRFDVVLAETADFLPLERGVITQRAAMVLDTLGDGVCVVGPKGELVWANRPVQDLPPGVLDSLCKLCFEAYEQFASGPPDARPRGKRFSLMPEPNKYYEVICSPVRDHQGLLRQVVAVVIDATSQRRQQMKLNAIDRAGRELVRLEDDASSRRNAAERLKVLQDRIIRYSRDVLDYQHFAVLLLDEKTNRLESIISEGLDEQATSQELFASVEGNGICGYVAATGRSYICPDVRRDRRYLTGLAEARSSLTVPLRLHDKVIGVLNVESDSVGAFGEEDRQFAEIFGNYVALALHILNLLATERHTAHSQVSGSISAELAGPLNEIVTDASELLEDYIGLDDLRKRLNSIIDRASEARRSVHRLTQAAKSGVLPDAAPPTHDDPVLRGRRVLVADDEEMIRQTIYDVLTSYGCEVDVAADGGEAKDLLERQRYDLVVSDIRMPGANGYELFAVAKAACAETQVILITAFGYDPNHSVLRASKQGLAAVLLKPFKANQLLEECRAALSV
ncbi:MAG: response regulator [Planctomycetota bacterium]|jgi:CheY-like chemotaxis protein